MKRKIKKEIQRRGLVRTTFVTPTQEYSSNGRDEVEAPTVLCKDCKITTPVELLIRVDALHVQCPRCLYVFYMDEAQRKALLAESRGLFR